MQPLTNKLRRQLIGGLPTPAGLVERLANQGARRQRAAAVRAFIAAADGSPAADAADYANSRAGALAQAEAMDPLLDGSAPFARLPPLEDWDGRVGQAGGLARTPAEPGSTSWPSA